MKFVNTLVIMIQLLALSSSAWAWDQTLWNPKSQKAETVATLPQHAIFVLGEEHYNPAVQNAEGLLIRSIRPTLVGWEFLNTIDRPTIEQNYARYLDQQLSTADFLQTLFPGATAPVEYTPLLEATRAVDAWLIPTNLTRAQKTPVTRGGIDALDPALRPKDFELGGANYFERFKEAMGPHPLPYPLENYYASQCLTDEVMATELLAFPSEGRKLLVTGSFHGDYRDGVVQSLARRSGKNPVIYIKILDASYYTEEELLEVFVDAKYGPIADLVYVVNEPITPEAP